MRHIVDIAKRETCILDSDGFHIENYCQRDGYAELLVGCHICFQMDSLAPLRIRYIPSNSNMYEFFTIGFSTVIGEIFGHKPLRS